MPSSDHMLQVYRDLADWHEGQGLHQLRDRFLVLAAASAQDAGQTDEAERLRQRLLTANPHHLLRSFPSVAQALQSSEVQTYVEGLRLEYPLHAAEDLLASVQSEPAPAPRQARTQALPPTAPVIDLDKQAEPLRVFRNEEDSEVPVLPAWNDAAPSKPRRSALPSPRPSRVVPTSAAARPATVVVKRYAGQEPQARPLPRHAASEPEPDEEAGGWVALALFVIVLAAALFLVAATLIQPFV